MTERVALVQKVRRLLQMKKSQISARFISENGDYEISMKAIGEEWRIKLGTTPEGAPFLWLKAKNMDYSSHEATIAGHEIGLEGLFDEAESILGLDISERQERAAARNDRKALADECNRRLLQGLDRILGGYRS